jgi:hypothetical protein
MSMRVAMSVYLGVGDYKHLLSSYRQQASR